jgi:FAD/FMN-containing dehydrogenase
MMRGMRDTGMTPSRVSRRGVLQGGLLGAAVLTAGACTRHVSGAGPASTSSAGHPSASGAGGPGTTGKHPTDADWTALAHSIDGDVVRPGDSDFAVASRLFNPAFDHRQPLAVVEVASETDVVEAIAFARRFGLPSRPKAGGHSYVGASTVSNGLVIDVGRMGTVHFDAASSVAKVGAGAKLYSVHAALARSGRTIPTGTCPTVGTAGLTLGGGIGVASREYGLTSDQVESLTVVTADGRTWHASADQHRELFWGCRGGGGGNFGIVTSIRYQTQPTRDVGFFLLTFPWSSAPAVIRGWASRLQAMDRSAWANLHLDASSSGDTTVRVVGTCHAGDESSQAAAMEAATGVGTTHVSTFSKSFLDAVSFLGGGTTSARQAFAAGSDVIPAMTPTLSRALTTTIERRAASGHSVSAILDPLTGRVGDVPVDATAFPWRSHLCDLQWYVGLPSGASPADAQSAYDWIATAHAAVAGYSAGGYVNYLEPHRSVRSYYGPNYARLRALKRAVDPTDFFTSPYTID